MSPWWRCGEKATNRCRNDVAEGVSVPSVEEPNARNSCITNSGKHQTACVNFQPHTNLNSICQIFWDSICFLCTVCVQLILTKTWNPHYSLVKVFNALFVTGHAVMRSLRPGEDEISDLSSAEANSGRKLNLNIVGLLEEWKVQNWEKQSAGKYPS